MMWSRRNFILLAAGLVASLRPGKATGAPGEQGHELIMVEEVGCRFCRKWDADVGGIYPASPEGQFAPLKRIRRGATEIQGYGPIVYTPTFILVKGGSELGRITGYPGQSYFWEELAPILAAAGFKGGEASKKT